MLGFAGPCRALPKLRYIPRPLRVAVAARTPSYPVFNNTLLANFPSSHPHASLILFHIYNRLPSRSFLFLPTGKAP
jgi:hypothetical protein